MHFYLTHSSVSQFCPDDLLVPIVLLRTGMDADTPAVNQVHSLLRNLIVISEVPKNVYNLPDSVLPVLLTWATLVCSFTPLFFRDIC